MTCILIKEIKFFIFLFDQCISLCGRLWRIMKSSTVYYQWKIAANCFKWKWGTMTILRRNAESRNIKWTDLQLKNWCWMVWNHTWTTTSHVSRWPNLRIAYICCPLTPYKSVTPHTVIGSMFVLQIRIKIKFGSGYNILLTWIRIL